MDHEPALGDRLLRYLTVHGSATASEARRELGVSQPAFSRLIASMRESVLVVGRARSTRYHARRQIPGVGKVVTVYEIDEHGESRKAALLHAIAPDGFFVESAVPEIISRIYGDLPYFLESARPGGFLGREVPAQHPEIGLPSDVRLWSADHCLEWASHHGWNLLGNFVIGDEALRGFLKRSIEPPNVVPEALRPAAYTELAQRGAATALGSSAGGEHPKFLALRAPGPVAVLVKFSPAVRDPTSRRFADLLVAEHLAHETLRAHDKSAPLSEIVIGGDRIFLEVERFDRLPNDGRRGLISFLALDAELVGRMRTWPESARALLDKGVIDEAAAEGARWLWSFGELIGNTDMHFANLSFFSKGERILGLAPAYDMLPMAYVPQHGHFRDTPLRPPVPDPAEAALWRSAREAALDFWARVHQDERISEEFRRIAAQNAETVDGLKVLADKLP